MIWILFVGILLKHNATIHVNEKSGTTPLSYGVYLAQEGLGQDGQHMNLLKILVENENNKFVDVVDGAGNTALIHAMYSKNPDKIKIGEYLLRNNASAYFQSIMLGENGLLVAASIEGADDIPMVELLLSSSGIWFSLSFLLWSLVQFK